MFRKRFYSGKGLKFDLIMICENIYKMKGSGTDIRNIPPFTSSSYVILTELFLNWNIPTEQSPQSQMVE